MSEINFNSIYDGVSLSFMLRFLTGKYTAEKSSRA